MKSQAISQFYEKDNFGMRSERMPLILSPDSTECFVWTGKPLELLGESEHTGGLYTTQRATVHKDDGSIAGHRHGFGECFYLLSGSLQFFAGNRSEILRSGDFIHIHHWEEEGFYVLKGTLAFYGENSSMNAFRVEVGPGTFVNLPRHQLHHFHNETDQPAETLILVAPAGLEKMFRKTGNILAPDVLQADKPTQRR